MALIVLGTVKLAFVFVGAHLFDTRGRRPLLFASLTGCAASLLVVSLTFLGQETPVSQTLTIVGLASYLAFFSIGIGPGNWVVVSECFSLSNRAKGMSVAQSHHRHRHGVNVSVHGHCLDVARILFGTGHNLLGRCGVLLLFILPKLPVIEPFWMSNRNCSHVVILGFGW